MSDIANMAARPWMCARKSVAEANPLDGVLVLIGGCCDKTDHQLALNGAGL